MTEKNGGCRACGICCDLYGATIHATGSDLERWRALDRGDLIRMAGEGGELWIDPESGERLDYCPFVRRLPDLSSICSIHEIKPDICRNYPTPLHAGGCVGRKRRTTGTSP